MDEAQAWWHRHRRHRDVHYDVQTARVGFLLLVKRDITNISLMNFLFREYFMMGTYCTSNYYTSDSF